MFPISDYISIFKVIFNQVQKLRTPFDRVYDRALKKWCRNDELRRTFADGRLASWEQLMTYLESPEVFPKETISFMDILLHELASNPETCGVLLSIKIDTLSKKMDNAFNHQYPDNA